MKPSTLLFGFVAFLVALASFTSLSDTWRPTLTDPSVLTLDAQKGR